MYPIAKDDLIIRFGVHGNQPRLEVSNAERLVGLGLCCMYITIIFVSLVLPAFKIFIQTAEHCICNFINEY
jgi:hypothetical protein